MLKSKPLRVQNTVASGGGRKWFEFRNAAGAEPVEILIYDQIGVGWDGSGISAKDFVEQLRNIPQDREIRLLINSPGGDVADALAIYNVLKLRRNKVKSRIDGLAASSASWLALAANEVEMPENALFMIHKTWSGTFGNAEEMRKTADVLEKHDELITNIYVEKTGKSKQEISDKMADETWFTGKEAKDFGLIDVLTPAQVARNSINFDFSRFRRVPGALTENQNKTAVQDGGQQQNSHMERKKIIALLNKHGAKVDDKATDEQLEAQLDAILNKKPEPAPATDPAKPDNKIVNLEAEVERLKAQNATERKTRIQREVDQCVSDCRIPANSRDNWVNRALSDETVLNDLKALPIPAKPEPVLAPLAVNADLREIGNHAVKVQGHERAAVVNEHKDRIVRAWNTNTISADLKRVVLLQDVVRAFAKVLFPLRSFSTVFGNVPLQGTDEVVVPYYALDTSSSTDFVAANGYDTFSNTSTSSKKVTVNKRKYQGLTWTSSELRRQPYLDLVRLAGLKVEKLGIDIHADVLSLITAANYGAAAYTGAASTFDSDVISDVRLKCNQAFWPENGRSLFVDDTYDNNLLKDTAIKSSMNFGGSEAIRQGKVPNIFGFDYFHSSMIPANGENLTGFAAFMSAILIATSPIQPTEEVRNLQTTYEVVVDDITGIALEYKRWGDATMDTSKEVIECNYGYALGEAAAIKRIVSA